MDFIIGLVFGFPLQLSTPSLDNRKRKKEKIFWTREWRNEEERT